MDRPYLILDCDYLCHRAKHIFGDLSNEDSITGVIYGFLKDLIVLKEKFFSNRFIFCWDCGESKRKKLWPDYKLHRRRRPQTPKEEEFERAFRNQMAALRDEHLSTIGFRNIFFQKGYESDDIIAVICRDLKASEQGIIVTADQDLYQCLRPHISYYNPRRRELMTSGQFRRKYRIFPKQWVEVKAIAGCRSDNIPGVYQVGENWALRYVQEVISERSKAYISIEREWKNVVLRNRKLIELPLPGTKPVQLREDCITQKGWNTVTKKLGMKSIWYRDIL